MDEFGNMSKKLPDDYQEFVKLFKVELKSTIDHVENVARHAFAFVRFLHDRGIALEISPQTAWNAGLHHDWGKWYISETVNLERKLTDEEFRTIKKHPKLGLQVLKKYDIDNPFVYDAVRNHHEDYWGGRGYPDGLQGDDIPLIARIISIVDVYEALYSKRSYKTNLPYEQVKIIMDDMRQKFDPKLFDLFFEMMDDKILNGNKTYL